MRELIGIMSCIAAPILICVILLGLEHTGCVAFDGKQKAPDNQIRYVLQDQNGRKLMTCTGGPEAVRACLEASRLLEEKEKIKPNN